MGLQWVPYSSFLNPASSGVDKNATVLLWTQGADAYGKCCAHPGTCLLPSVRPSPVSALVMKRVPLSLTRRAVSAKFDRD